ncbi:MAG: tetratricopeptide repeat protein [Chitinophagaceae bacterium]
MRKSFFVLWPFCILLFACGNNETSDVLSQSPFDKLTDSIRHAPKNADLYYRRGILLYRNNYIPHAQQDVQKAWTLSPKEEYALSLTNLLERKNTDSAIAFLQEAQKRIPASVAIQVNLAKYYQEKNKLQEALSICKKIIAEHPNQLDALILKSEILKSLNQDQEALSTLEEAYSYAPFDVALTYNLAFEYAEAKNPKVLKLCDSLIRRDISKTHAEPYYFKGLYYSNTNNEFEALRFFDEAIRRDYNFLDAYMEKGQILYNQKKYADALKTFQLVVTITTTYADGYYWIAKTQQAMGNKQDAKLNYQRAYGLDKSLIEAKQAAESL